MCHGRVRTLLSFSIDHVMNGFSEKIALLRNTIKRSLTNKSGWHRDARTLKVIAAVAFIAVVGVGAWRAQQQDGMRFFWKLEKVDYRQYRHLGPNFSFAYPDYYVIDEDAEKKFGADYLAGMRLKTDRRTGCDIRNNPFGLNFSKSDDEIRTALEKDLSASAKEFRSISADRIRIDGEDAFELEFSFTDPINDRVRLSQTIVSHGGGNYMIVCGTGEYQYPFFQDDFDDFYSKIRWSADSVTTR